jgi:hypothetical protein
MAPNCPSLSVADVALRSPAILIVPDNESRNIPEVVLVRRGRLGF